MRVIKFTLLSYPLENQERLCYNVVNKSERSVNIMTIELNEKENEEVFEEIVSLLVELGFVEITDDAPEPDPPL